MMSHRLLLNFFFLMPNVHTYRSNQNPYADANNQNKIQTNKTFDP